MSRSYTLGIVVLLLVGTTAGCMYVPNDLDEPVAVVFHGDLNISSSGFHMDGYVYTNGPEPDKPVIEDLHICLYDESQSLIAAHAVGDIDSTSGNVSVALTSETIPKYVVLESRDLWGDNFRTHGHLLKDGRYITYDIHSESERFWDYDEGYPNETTANDTEYTSCGE